MKLYLIIAALCLSMTASAQRVAEVRHTNVLIADETWYSDMSGGNFKIVTSNQTIDSLLRKQYSWYIKRYSFTIKKDRYGEYLEYSFTFSSQGRKPIFEFFK